MRKFDLIAGGAALVLVSVSITLYIITHPLRRDDEGQLHVGLSNAPERVLSPMELLTRSSEGSTSGAASAQESTSTVHARSEPRRHLVYPEWKTSDTLQVSGAQPVCEANDYTAPLWSPIGLDLACTRGELGGIYLVGPSKSAVTVLSDTTKPGTEYSWNPDGMSLKIHEPDGQNAELMITGERYPAVESPRKVFERDNLIYSQPEDSDPVRISGQEDRFYGPRLSPDQTKVVYLGRQTGIYLASVDGSQILAVGPGANPSWLPDSSGIVYDIPVSDGSVPIDGDLWYASADGRERTNLTQTPGVAESHPAVAPDGERIAFSCLGAIHVGKLLRKVKN